MLVIIPARSGSKGVPNKNIRPLNGKPLAQWSLDFASLLVTSDIASSIVFSSDSSSYADQLVFPNECKFHLRSSYASSDVAPASSYVSEVLSSFPGHSSFLILQPTCPFRDLASAISMFRLFSTSHLPTLISVFQESYISDFVSYNLLSTTKATQLTSNNNKQIRRQDHKSSFIRSGSYYFVDTNYFFDTGHLIAPETLYYVESRLLSINIDTLDDFSLAQAVALSWNQS